MVAQHEASPPSSFAEATSRLRACWVTQAPFGWAVTPARWTRRVSSSMKHSTCSRRSEMVSSVKKSHATIPADDHLLDLLAERRPPRVGPCAGDQAAVSAQQGQGPDQEARPARPRQDTADGGEQGPVGRFELRSWSLAAEHGELVTQDKDLKVLGGVTAGELGEELDGAAQRQVRKSCQHRAGLRGGGHGGATVASRGRSEPPAHGPCLNICTLRGWRFRRRVRRSDRA